MKGSIAVCLLLLALVPGLARAEVKVDPSKVYTVTKSGQQYQCLSVRSKPTIVLPSGPKLRTGADMIKRLERELRRKDQLRSKKGKRRLKELKQRVRDGNAACGNPDPNGGSASLAPLSRRLTRADIRYLLDKSALGLSSREEQLVSLGLSHGIDALLDELMQTHEEPAGLLARVSDELDGQLGNSTTQTPAGQRIALYDLWTHTNNPYQEKFALALLTIWTAAGDVIEDETFRYAFWEYYARLRNASYADTSMPDLAVAITRDPLMLIYLNNELNLRGNPNENYARELMELFTLGPTNLDGEPNYTETRTDGTGDIAVAAKMLTGWKVKKNYSINRLEALYDAARHEPGPHVMFAGTAHSFQGESDEDLVRGIFAHHPGVKHYYARELLKLYITPHPPRSLIEGFGQVIESNGYRLQDAMRVLLRSEAFFDPAYKDTVPMNSLEFAAKAARLLELYNGVNPSYVEWQLRKMGIQFNYSPSVFWYNGDVWSSASVGLEKANCISELLGNSAALQGASWTPAKVLPSGAVTEDALIDAASARIGITALNEAQRQNILSYLRTQLQYTGSYTPFTYDNTNPEHQRTKGLGVLYLLLMTPEFNLL